MTGVQTLTCANCGSDWQRPTALGRRPHRCVSCRNIARSRVVRAAQQPTVRKGPHIDPNTAGYRLAHSVTGMRLAIELATGALKIGRPAEALAHLQACQAPTRVYGRRGTASAA
jgi:hypothetical protein